MSSRPLSDLLSAIERGASIEIAIVDPSGINPLASSDTYIALMTNLARLNRLEHVSREMFALYTKYGQLQKAEAVNSWYNEQTMEIDELVAKLEKNREMGTADEIEEEMAQIDKLLQPALERIRGVLRAIAQRHVDAIMAISIEDLIT